MKRMILNSLLAAVTFFVLSLPAGEILALFTFSDIGVRGDGTTQPDKELSVGMYPTLELVEAGGGLAAPAGQNGTSTFTDADGIDYTVNRSASWTTGLRGQSENYFELECSTLGWHELALRFDLMASANTGPTTLWLEYANGTAQLQPLDTIALTRDGDWHAYTNTLNLAGLEDAERIRIRGTWSADATGGSGRLDNLQLSGAFTNGLTRLARYSFTAGFAPTETDTGFWAGSLDSSNPEDLRNYNNDTNTWSGKPMVGTLPGSMEIRDNYFGFTIMPMERSGMLPTHLKFYAKAGAGSGTLEPVLQIGGEECALGSVTVGNKETLFSFRVPEPLRQACLAPMQCYIYFDMENLENSMRIDDLELLGMTAPAPGHTLVADYPFSGSTASNRADLAQVTASEVVSTGAGAIGFYTAAAFAGSASGTPALSVDGWDGAEQDRYLSIDLVPDRNTAFQPTMVFFYARTGSGSGFLQATLGSETLQIPLGTAHIEDVVRPYYFAVPPHLIPAVARGERLQLRVHAWGFAKATTTLRLDDLQVEGVLEDLPPLGTLITIR